MKKKILSILLVLTIVVGTLSGTFAYAVNSPDQIDDYYEYDSVTYFNAKSTHVADSTRMFIYDCLNASHDKVEVDGLTLLDDHSTALLWQYLGIAIQDENGAGTDDNKFKNQFDAVLDEYIKNSENILGKSKNIKNGDNDYDVYSTAEPQYATSLSDAGADIESQIYSWYRNTGGGRKDKYDDDPENAGVVQNSTLATGTSTGDVYWTMAGAFKNSGTNKVGHYQAVAVIFSDFYVDAITPENEGNNYVSVSSAPIIGENTYASSVRNDTGTKAKMIQEVANKAAMTVTSEVNGSEEYTFGQAIGAHIEFGKDSHPVHGGFSIDLTFSQAISEGWSQSESSYEEDDQSYSMEKELEPYTNVMMSQAKELYTTETTYNCPVALNFSVTIVEYTLDPSDNDADASTKVLATYTGSAREAIKQCAIVEKSIKGVDKIKWSNMDKKDQKVAEKLGTTAPVAGSSAKFTVSTEYMVGEITGLAPIYALYSVQPIEDIDEINMVAGEYMYMDDIELEGLNRFNAPYYGFNMDKGHWILLDENGKEVTDATTESHATLKTNPVTGKVTLNANTAGTVYVKYLIDENCYNTAEHGDVFAKNADLDKTAIIQVNIAAEDTVRTVSLRQSAGDNGEAKEMVVTKDKLIRKLKELEILIDDGTEEPRKRLATWMLYSDAEQAIEEGTPITREMLANIEADTYYIRAKVGNKYSNTVTVVVEDVKLAEITIPTCYNLGNGTFIELSKLPVDCKNQNGDEIDISDVTWHCDSDSAVIEDDILTITGDGEVSVYASSDDITSNTMTVTASPNEAIVTDMKVNVDKLSENGGTVTVTVIGINLPEEGVEISSGNITAVTSGNSERQTATMTFPEHKGDSSVTYTISNEITPAVIAKVTVLGVDDDDDTGNTNNNGDNKDNNKNDKNNNKNDNKDNGSSPDTGDTSNLILYGVISVVALVAIILILLKKRK